MAKRTLKQSEKRAFTSSSGFARQRSFERVRKGRWKESILSSEGLSARRARNGETSSSLPRLATVGGHHKILRFEGSWQPAVELELQMLKESLQGKKTPDGDKSTYAGIDPELKHFDDFEHKIKRCFENVEGLGKGRSANPFQSSLFETFMQQGRAGLRKHLLFAYLDDIVGLPSTTDAMRSIPKHLDLRYPSEWYNTARGMQRKIHLHVGPTNSGKTYHALKRMEEAGNGMYAGPLRLLAQEVYSRFQSKGTPCDLMTGDEVRISEGTPAKLSSHTVEMVDCSKAVDVAVIDEIQMIAHKERGWAWTRALLGMCATELHLCGETRVVPLIRELAASMGDTLHIHHYDRLNPLKAMSRSLRGNLKNLRRGDCIVSFSVLNIHTMKKQIELDTGRRVAIVYGSLPPDIRAQQAALFNDSENDYDFLVASDAIGMGLNLSIKRIVFETVSKYDGSRQVELSVSQIKQIAGRAGRYRTANQRETEVSEGTKVIDSQDAEITSFKGTARQSTIGLVTCLDERDLRTIQTALNSEPEPIKAAGLQPPVEYMGTLAQTMPSGTPVEYLIQRMVDHASLHPRYFMCSMLEARKITSFLGDIKGLDVVQSCILAAAPMDSRTDLGRKVTTALARCVAELRAVRVVDVPEISLDVLDQKPCGDRQYLLNLEQLHKSLILFSWLSYRFTNIFIDREMAMHAKDLVERRINSTLLEFSANPKLRTKLMMMRQAQVLDETSNPSSDSTQYIPGKRPKGSEGSLADKNLGDSLNSTSALPIDWEDRLLDETLNAPLMDRDQTIVTSS